MFTDGQGKGLSDKSRVTTNFQKPAACRFFVSSFTHFWVDMRILLSNDDGYFSPGIECLARALSQVAEITVVAPERDRSGASNSLTLDRPLSLKRAANGYYHVNGTPTDCVHLAVTGMLDELPDMVVSGINHGCLLYTSDAADE